MNTFTAKTVIDLYQLGLIPEQLIQGHKKSSGLHPIEEAKFIKNEMQWIPGACVAGIFLFGIVVVLPAVAAYMTGRLEIAFMALVVAIVLPSTVLRESYQQMREIVRRKRAFANPGGFGHDLGELHETVPGILRSGSDPKMVDDAYRTKMRTYGVMVEATAATPEGAEAITVINGKFDLG